MGQLWKEEGTWKEEGYRGKWWRRGSLGGWDSCGVGGRVVGI